MDSRRALATSIENVVNKQYGGKLSTFASACRELGGADAPSYESLRKYLTAQASPTLDNLIVISQTCNRSIDSLVGLQGDAALETDEGHDGSQTMVLTVYDVQASAGPGAEVMEQVIGEYVVDRSEIETIYKYGPARPFVVEVVGDSMEPDLLAGDRVVIEPVETHQFGDAIFIFRLDEMILIKRLQRLPGHRIRISSSNSLYHPYEIDLKKEPNFRVLGRVWGKFKRY